jgi:hypothetical protein
MDYACFAKTVKILWVLFEVLCVNVFSILYLVVFSISVGV